MALNQQKDNIFMNFKKKKYFFFVKQMRGKEQIRQGGKQHRSQSETPCVRNEKNIY